MDALEFLRTILPEYGIHYLTLFTKDVNPTTNKPYTYHKYYLDLEDMAAEIPRWENDPKFVATYHACASYLKPSIEVEKNGETRKKYRVEENWSRAKSFWIDIDCGQKKFDAGQGYLTKMDGAKAITAFAKKLGLPRPMIVDSGNGIHIYWPLTKDIPHTKWVMVAKWLKSCLAHEGVLADSSRTADFASILRPVGSANRKGDAKDVKVISTCESIEPAVFAQALQTFVTKNDVKLIKESAKKTYNADLNSDLTAHLPTYPNVPVDLNEIANKCAQVAAMRDTNGGVPYEHWRGVAGLAKFCEGGEELMHQWSEGHPDYSYAETQAKLDTWNADPTSCDHFEAQNSAGCVGCEHKGKFKGPIVLGRVIPIIEESTAEVITDEGTVEEVAVPAMPYGYVWDGQLMSRLIPDKDGVLQPIVFCHDLFYLTSRIRGEDGTYRHGVRMHMAKNKIREFDISGESIASNTDMLRALAKHELHTSNNKNAGFHMAAYLRDQLKALKSQVEETSTMTSFGWRDDRSFLLGDRLHCKDGTTRTVLIGGNARKYAKHLSLKGTVEGYAKGLNYLYNREGAEPWQYALCAGWGTLLIPMCESLYKGLTFALHGGDTARGKTTVCHASLAAFGAPAELSVNGKQGFTPLALWAVLGTFKSVPILLDELTSMDPSVVSDIAYGVSNGRERIRLKSQGGVVSLAESAEWRLNMFVTGNMDFHGMLAANQANSQAEAVRVIQISVDRYVHVAAENAEGDTEARSREITQALEEIDRNTGVAGDLMVKYVVANYDRIAEEVKTMVHQLTVEIPSPKYRFYRSHTACTIVMARICKQLGIIDFDVDALYTFIIATIRDLAGSVMLSNTVTDEEAFSRMVSSLASRILVTSEFRDKRDGRGPETPRSRIIGEVAGRYILGTQKEQACAGHMMLAQKEIRDWCIKNRTDYNVMINKLSASNYLVSRGEKVTLTKGTDYPTVQQRCIIVDMFKIDKDAAVPALTLVSNQFDGEAVGDV
jgi:hypothetical protein